MTDGSRVAQVLVCEPQCTGFEHAAFNAALLETVRLAFPGAGIELLGEADHIERVRALAPRSTEHTFTTIAVPKRTVFGLGRVLPDRRVVRQALAHADRGGARFLLFSSITDTGLLALRTILGRHRREPAVLAIPHAILWQAAKPAIRASRHPIRRYLQLGRILASPQPANLRLVALSESILGAVRESVPGQDGRWGVIEIPSLRRRGDRRPPADRPTPAAGERPSPVRFAFLGVTTKGFDTFAGLARELRTDGVDAEFTLAGYADGPIPVDAERFVDGVGRAPLDDPTYEARAVAAHYAVGTAKPDHYRFTASASFVDAVTLGLPGVYLRNRYVEHYFAEFGDIGYLCDNHAEMGGTLRALAREFPSERYAAQLETLARAGARFTPETQAERLAHIVAGMIQSGGDAAGCH